MLRRQRHKKIGGIVAEAVAVEAAEAVAIGAHPEVALVIDEEATDLIFGQAVLGGVGDELAVVIAGEAAAARADPEATVAPVIHRGDVIVDQVAATLGEDLEVDAVEADEAFLGAEPEVAVAGLDEHIDAALGQAVFDGPDIDVILREGFGGIERQGLLGIHTGAACRTAKRAHQPENDMEQSLLHVVMLPDVFRFLRTIRVAIRDALDALAGKRTVKTLPFPFSLSTNIDPSSDSVSR